MSAGSAANCGPPKFSGTFSRGFPAACVRILVVPSGSPAIAIHELTKRYGRLTAVNRLNLEVARGEIFGFLGLNGAGKTTTIRILLDLLRPTSGTAAVFGHDCQSGGLKTRSA